MTTHIITDRIPRRTGAECDCYEVISEPLPFDRIEAHCLLGGRAVGVNGDIVAVFGPGDGPMFEGLWDGFTWHIVVRFWQQGVEYGAGD